jgi:serine/threonine-protein kinase RsbW
MPKVELHFGALPTHVRTARLVAAALGRRIGLDAVVIDEVKLAVGEACSRAVNVHRAAAVSDPIVVQFRDDDDILEVSVWDLGPPGAQLPPSGDTEGAASLTPGAGAEAEAEAEAAAADLLQEAANSTRKPADLGPSADPATFVPRLGLAMIAGLVDDMSVDERADPGGTVVTMRWPIVAF